MSFRFSLIALFFTLVLSACASKPDLSKGEREQFTTDIQSDGSKRFEFAIVKQTNKSGEGRSEGRGEGKRGGNRGEGGRRGQGGNRGQGQQRGGQQSGESTEDLREDFIALLDAKIAETAYCRNGYIELDFSQMSGKTEFVGECQESASAEDKKRWD